MKIRTDIFVRSINSRLDLEVDKPNICPVCKQSGDHTVLSKDIDRENVFVSITLECTMCCELFFAKYNVLNEEGEFANYAASVRTALKAVYPFEDPANNLPEEMSSLYPDFEKIYNQALVAESQGLDLITGIAYRKSLEFLVKLFLIEKFPSDEQKIRDEFLGASIKRIEYSLIQNLATAATWLGNDEGHFTRKHPDYNVADMKQFILSLSHLIVAEKVAIKAEDFIS